MAVQTLVVGGEKGGFMAVYRHWLWGVGRGGLMAIPHAGCRGGEAVVFKAGPDAGCENERRASHGSPRLWLWMGEAGVLMAVPDAGCGRESRCYLWQSKTLVVGGRRRRFSRQSLSLVVGGLREGGSDGSARLWL